MAKKYFTILIVSHGRSRFRKLQISRNFVLALAGVGLAVAASALWAPGLAVRIEAMSARAEQLDQENAWLKAERDQFEKRLANVTDRLTEFEGQAVLMADALGVDGLPQQIAAGGTAPKPIGGDAPAWEADIQALDDRTRYLGESMGEIGGAFQQRMDRLAATPSIMPVPGWFSHGYGWRKDPFHGRRQFHRGVDIVADTGTPVRTTAHGVISRVTRVPDYGKVIDVSHGHGYVTRYGHLSEILVRSGQRVERGQTIGRVGSTGRSTGPHLHYEVHRDGKRINPWKYLGQRGD